MTATSHLPDDVAEVASIHIAIGMGGEGTGCSYNFEGLSPEAAIGYLTTVVDQLREDVKLRYALANDDIMITGHLTCPECGEDIDLGDEDEEDDEEDEE